MSKMALGSGLVFDFLDIKNSKILIEDIALGLSRIPRFSGHTTDFYSVAQHSCMVCDLLPEELKLQGLMHDAPEFIMGDMVTPLKKLIPKFSKIEHEVWCRICDVFGIDKKLHKSVKDADYKAFVIEYTSLKNNLELIKEEESFSNIKDFKVKKCWDSSRSYDIFISKFNQYYSEP